MLKTSFYTNRKGAYYRIYAALRFVNRCTRCRGSRRN